MTKSNRNLTSVLWIIGKSEIPLSSGQIENESQLTKYVYDMIEYLAPKDSTIFTKLFDLENPNTNKITNEMKYKILDKMIKLYQLSWEIEKESLELNMNVELIAKGSFQNLKILYGKDKSIIINGIHVHIPEKFLRLQIQDGIEKKDYRILMKRDQKNKIAFYTLTPVFRNSYLDITYDPAIQKRIDLIENSDIRYFGTKQNEDETPSWKSLEKQHRIERLKGIRSYWRYSLNIIGFLHYLYLENENNRKDKKKRIKKVISNSVIKNKFLFLKLWEEFEKIGFPVIDFLFTIAKEFQNQLHFDKTRLLIIVTERYFVEIEHFLGRSSNKNLFSFSIEIKGLDQYRLEILEYIYKNLTDYMNNLGFRIEDLKEKEHYNLISI